MKKFFKIIIFTLLGLFILFVIYFIIFQIKALSSGANLITSYPAGKVSGGSLNSGASSVPKDIIINNPDLNGLDRTLENIRQAILDNNISLLNQFYSAPTLNYYASSGGGRIIKTYLKDVQFSNVRKVDASEALVKISQVEMSGHTENQDVLFVRERDGWKMGVVETKQYFGN